MTTRPESLRYYGPDHHAAWCPGNADHGGPCLDQLLDSDEFLDAVDRYQAPSGDASLRKQVARGGRDG